MEIKQSVPRQHAKQEMHQGILWGLLAVALVGLLVSAAGLATAFYMKIGTPGYLSYWETNYARKQLETLAQDKLNRWKQESWEPGMIPENSQLVMYRLYFVDEQGKALEKIYSNLPKQSVEVQQVGDGHIVASLPNGPRRVYREYVELTPDDQYHSLGQCLFRDGQPFFATESYNHTLWCDDGRVNLKSYYSQDYPYAARYVEIELYVNEESLHRPQARIWSAEKYLQRGWVIYEMLHDKIGWMAVGLLLSVVVGWMALHQLVQNAGCTLGSKQPHLCSLDKIPLEVQAIFLCLAGYFTWRIEMGLLQWSYYIVLDDLTLTPHRETLFWSVPILLALALVPFMLACVAVLLSMVRWSRVSRLSDSLCPLWRDMLHAIPLVWKCVLAFCFAIFLQCIILLNARYAPWQGVIASAVLWGIALICISYGALGLDALQQQIKAFQAGNYQTKPQSRIHYAALRQMGEDLSQIGEGMNKAVEARTKSERMKTELITNVSHDLKTPLTSIINYADLLQKEPLPPKAAEYADIIARQGQRLHHLTLDLVEASKAASGVLPCDKRPTNLQELCQQAMGEYTDRLIQAGLIPVLDLPEESVVAQLDGQLTWRILENLLSNACKYAQPGTRVYLVLERAEKVATMTVKNISREPLNIPAEELMERFVRGDTARSSEGSGLGLSIARSLAELQGGHFDLYINGDLFQAQATFPIEETACNS